MIQGKKVIAIIPARGGSKGLPGKNVKPLLGKPLVAWSIKQALKSKYIDYILLSTDGEEIAKIGKQYGAEVPFLRPSEYATDDSPSSDLVIDALGKLESMGQRYDYIVLLEPTSPLRKKDDIDEAIKLLVENEKADSLISIGKIHLEHPYLIKKINNDGYVMPYIKSSKSIYQRQQADEALFPYGVIYMSKVSSFKEKLTFYTDKTIPYLIERWQNYEIDDEIDFVLIETIMNLRKEM